MTLDRTDFFLASSEGYDLDQPRRCQIIQAVKTNDRDDLLLVRIEPSIIGQKYGLGGHDIDVVLVAARHEGQSVAAITDWPVYVHVARLLVPWESREILAEGEYESIAWAELYETEDDAGRR